MPLLSPSSRTGSRCHPYRAQIVKYDRTEIGTIGLVRRITTAAATRHAEGPAWGQTAPVGAPSHGRWQDSFAWMDMSESDEAAGGRPTYLR